MPDVYLIDLARGPVGDQGSSTSSEGALAALLDHQLQAHEGLDDALDEVLLGTPPGCGLRAQDAVLASSLSPRVSSAAVQRPGAGSDLALQMGVFGVASGYREAVLVLGAGAAAPAPHGRDWSEAVRWRFSPAAPAELAAFCTLRAGLEPSELAAEHERRAEQREDRADLGPLPFESVLKGKDLPGPATTWPEAHNARPADRDTVACALLAESSLLRRQGWTARCRLAAMQTIAGDPAATWHRPAEAAERCLNRLQLRPDEIHLFQVDTTCGALPLALARRLGVDMGRVNVDGDALDTGRCAGSAALLELGRLVSALERRDQRFGLLLTATLDGHATAVLVDREFYL